MTEELKLPDIIKENFARPLIKNLKRLYLNYLYDEINKNKMIFEQYNKKFNSVTDRMARMGSWHPHEESQYEEDSYEYSYEYSYENLLKDLNSTCDELYGSKGSGIGL